MATVLRGSKINQTMKWKGEILNALDLPKLSERKNGQVYYVPVDHTAKHDMGLCHNVFAGGTCFGSAATTLDIEGIADIREHFRVGDLIYIVSIQEESGSWRGFGKIDEELDGPFEISSIINATQITTVETLSDEIQSLTAGNGKAFKVFRTESVIVPQKSNVYTSDIPKSALDERVWVDTGTANTDLTNAGTSLFNSVGDGQILVGDIVTITAGNVVQSNIVSSITSDTVLVMTDAWSSAIISALPDAASAVATFTVTRPLSIYVDIATDSTAKTLKAVEATSKFNTVGSFQLVAGDEVFMEVSDATDPTKPVTHWLRGIIASVVDDQTFVLEEAISTNGQVIALFDEELEAVEGLTSKREPKIFLTDASTTAVTLENTLGAFAGWNTVGVSQVHVGDKVSIDVKDANGINWTLKGIVASITDDDTIVLATKLNQEDDINLLLDGSALAVSSYTIETFAPLESLTLTGGSLLIHTSAGWKQFS